jgi:hypothetical protein
MYADHLGCNVRVSNGVFTLVERTDKKREIGAYRSVDELERGVIRYNRRILREMGIPLKHSARRRFD